MTSGRSIDYDALTQDALRSVVRSILTQVAKNGLPGDHHFYIAFDTQAPKVVLSRRLKEKYPEEMMIVLQHRFWDLMVTDELFEVKLTFDSIPERLVIPFASLRVFFDPSVRYTLQFGDVGAVDETNEDGSPRRRRDGALAEGNRGGQRGAGDRRSKSRSKPRDADNGADDPMETPGQQVSDEKVPSAPAPTVFVPRAVEGGGKSAGGKVGVNNGPTAVPASGPDSQGDAAAPAGAKVFSLDQFRKK